MLKTLTTRQDDSPTFCALQTNAICPHQKTVSRMTTFLSNDPHFKCVSLKYTYFLVNIYILGNIYISVNIWRVTILPSFQMSLSEIYIFQQIYICQEIYIFHSKYTACNYFAGRWSDLRSEKKFPISEAIHSLECFMIYIFRNIPSLVLQYVVTIKFQGKQYIF